MRSATSGPRDWGVLVALATALAFIAKLYISYRSFGTVDVAYWQQFAMRSHLGAVLYRASPIFNHPPAMLHVLPALGAFVQHSGLPFPFCLRLPGIIADVGSVWLVWRITQRVVPPLASPIAVLLLAVAPASVMISGYHGNTDALMVFFVLLAVHLRESVAAWAAGIALGMAMNVKVVPVIFAPALILYRYELRRGLVLAAATAATFAVASMPYLLDDPWYILQRLFGYNPGGRWGLPLAIELVAGGLRFPALYSETWSNVPGVLELYALAVTASAVFVQWGKFVLLGAIAVVAYRMNRLDRPPPLFMQCGVVAFLFLFFSPGFGVQYIAWLLPWAVAAGPLIALVFYAASGVFLYWTYATKLEWNDTTLICALACWLTVGLVLIVLFRRALGAAAGTTLRERVGHLPPAMRLAIAAVAGLVLIGLLRVNARALAASPGFLDGTFVTASSTYGDGVMYPAQAAVDGRSDVDAWPNRGGWNSAATPTDDAPESLTFMFAITRTVGHVDLYGYPDPKLTLTSFVFQYRADGRWQDIEATRIRNNVEATRWSFGFPVVHTRQIRLLISGSADQWARVLEVEFADAGKR